MYLAYSVLTLLAFLAASPYFVYQAIRYKKYIGSLRQRLGYLPISFNVDGEESIWIHAVSVGEARAAAPLVGALRGLLPDHAVVMTCTTAAGRETLKQVYGESVRAVFLPYDYPESVQGFLERFRPRLGVLMETELWPNLLAQCEAHGVPVVLANARMLGMNDRQLLRHVYLPSALSWMFSSLHTSVGFALVGAVVGEYLGSAAGLGYRIAQAEGVFDVTGVFSGMVVLAAFVVVIDAAVSLIESRLLVWRPKAAVTRTET